jgi:hypothetical protein
MKKIPNGRGCFCADPTYLSRRNCRMMYEKGRTPYIKPKKNIQAKKKGCQAWRDMIKLYLKDKKSFMKRYHGRSRVESVYSILKRCFGNHLSSKRRSLQRRELHPKSHSLQYRKSKLPHHQEGRQTLKPISPYCQNILRPADRAQIPNPEAQREDGRAAS